MSEAKSELDEMEQTNYSITSTSMDPKNNEELIIYVSWEEFLCNFFCFYCVMSTNRNSDSSLLRFVGAKPPAECPGQVPVHVGADNIANRRHGKSVSWELWVEIEIHSDSTGSFLINRRIDDLEKSISDLMTQAGVEGHQQLAAAEKWEISLSVITTFLHNNTKQILNFSLFSYFCTQLQKTI